MDTVAATNGVKAGVINSDMNYMGQTGPYIPMYDKLSLSNAKIDGAPWVAHLSGNSPAIPLGTVNMENSTYTSISNPSNTVKYATVVWTNVTINGTAVH